ncbi:MAG: hypothetical protein E3K32_03325 [wastewater metagenome]|nr:hypothetical protein [Candidatus Loosdrechtia aerotolerans]
MGCTLHVTKKDYEQIRETAKKMVSPAASVLMKNYKNAVNKLDSKTREYLQDLFKNQKVDTMKLVMAMANGNVSQKQIASLPSALKNIESKNRNVLDLFNRIHHSSWKSGNADSMVYKVLATSRLLNRSGNGFSIKKDDSFVIGRHLKVQYPTSRSNTDSLLHEAVDTMKVFAKEGVSFLEDSLKVFMPQPHGLESDLTIRRGGQSIGVDFSYKKGDSNCTVSKEKLQQIADSLETGRFREYHIVSNSNFTRETRQIVETINSELEASGKHTIGLHEKVS